ncbi:trehalose-6-phosphate synthase2 [Zea mays]|uniref:Trehalose-6-phosphate synthase2 n=1 Tax=Zea mays TaxID=4577 RepID=A0A1D6JU28_MAIZE|nr:trehalose-6-phosphate synthase2 [Zea mays]
MASRSYSNLLDLATGAADQAPAVAALGALRRRLPRVVTTPGLIDDEDMFQLIATAACGDSLASKAEVFACTVGRKPSKAKYYLDDAAEVVRLMQGLSYVSEELALANQRDEDEDSSLDDVWE